MESRYKRLADETAYPVNMPDDCVAALESARAGGWNVRVFVGDVETGKAWPEEFEVYGRVSRTMGPAIKAAMIVAPRQNGGGPFGDHVLAVMTGPGRFTYRHPKFDAGKWERRPGTEGYAADVWHDGALQSRHRSVDKADRYIAFMTGQRLAP